MLKRYLVSYDLRKPGRNYETLYKALKSYEAWAHPLESVWVLETRRSATEIRDHLGAHVDGNDQLLVTGLTVEWASYNLATEQTNWLQRVA